MLNQIAALSVFPVRAFADNYVWLIESPRQRDQVLVVDPGEAGPVLAELDRRGASLAGILLTHHHPDHIGGVPALLQRAAVPVIGPEDARISTLTRAVKDGDSCEFADLGLKFEILQVPGHTLSHIAFVGHDALFCGDTLFSAGCGRMFEGTPEQMTASLSRLADLPPATRVFCGHEYTAANLKFALAVEPKNQAAVDYSRHVATVRAANQPSLPSTIELERQVNPFLRTAVHEVKAAAERHAGRPLASPPSVFATLRAWKDGFR
jgi:hydroxyacylglutathione hydrolase